MSTLLEFSITPIGDTESIGEHVARCLEIIEESGIPYRLNAMSTVMEGEWRELMYVVKRCLDAVSQECPRVACEIRMDTHKGEDDRLDAQVESVERRLGHRLSR